MLTGSVLGTAMLANIIMYWTTAGGLSFATHMLNVGAAFAGDCIFLYFRVRYCR